MNKFGRSMPFIVMFVCALIMVVVILCDIGLTMQIGSLICLSMLSGVSGTLLVEIIKEIKGDKDNEKKQVD